MFVLRFLTWLKRRCVRTEGVGRSAPSKSQSDVSRQRYVRDLWTYLGLLIAFMPLPAQIFALLVLTFLTLSILDAEADDAG